MCHQNKQFAGNILQVLHGLTTTVGKSWTQEAGGGADGSAQPKQEPHTKMWGTAFWSDFGRCFCLAWHKSNLGRMTVLLACIAKQHMKSHR